MFCLFEVNLGNKTYKRIFGAASGRNTVVIPIP